MLRRDQLNKGELRQGNETARGRRESSAQRLES